MAGLAHDASGPASSEPAGIAAQHASQPTSSDKGKLRVFISYSREDLDFADQLAAALDFSGFECVIDREGVSGGEAWKRRLGNLIGEADTVVVAKLGAIRNLRLGGGGGGTTQQAHPSG
jgi:TIR domain